VRRLLLKGPTERRHQPLERRQVAPHRRPDRLLDPVIARDEPRIRRPQRRAHQRQQRVRELRQVSAQFPELGIIDDLLDDDALLQSYIESPQPGEDP
jgi:hypothetical protein